MSRSDGAWLNWTDAVTPSRPKRGMSSSARSCACSMRGLSPSGAHSSRVSSKASSASRFARSPIACTATGQPARAPRADDLGELLAARDLDPGAVEHSRGLRAQRPVHEDLQIADAQPVVAEPGAEPDLLQPGDVVVRQGLPDAECRARPRRPGAARTATPRASRPCRARRSLLGTRRSGVPPASRPRTRRLTRAGSGRGTATPTPRAGRPSARRRRPPRPRLPRPGDRRPPGRARQS